MSRDDADAHDSDEGVPDSPTALSKPSWKFVLRSTVREFMADECTDLAAALTYYAALAAAPALVALTSVLGLLGDGQKAVDNILDVLAKAGAPADTIDQVRPLVERVSGGTGAGLALVLGLVLALWSASGYVGAFGRALNRVFEVEEGRPVWKLRPWILLWTLVVVVLAAAVVFSLVMSGPLVSAVGDAVGLSGTAVTVWNIVKWPVVVILVVALVAILYWATPNVRQPKFRWISPGAIVALVVWAVASLGFAFYVSNFASFGATYGTFAGIFVALLWLWITNLALLFGAELDSEVLRARQLQGGVAAETDLQLEPRDSSGIEKKADKARAAQEEGRALRTSGD